MMMFGTIGFTAPWLLLGLLVLPIIWIMLRAVPPAPIKRRFPGITLLLGLEDEESQSDKTPWWLLLLRLFALGCVIIGFAGPVLNPQTNEAVSEDPLLILLDGTWADARDWSKRIDRVDSAITTAEATGRPVTVVTLTDLPPVGITFVDARAARQSLSGITPKPFDPDLDAARDWAGDLDGPFSTLWMTDGVERIGQRELLSLLEGYGDVTLFQSSRPVLALGPARLEDGKITIPAMRAISGTESNVAVQAVGLDPSGAERVLDIEEAAFAADETTVDVIFDLPPELRNRITRFALRGVDSAGAVTLVDDTLRRREIALLSGGGEHESVELLDPLHYLRQALSPSSDLIDVPLSEALLANPDVMIFADVASLSELEAEDLTNWIEGGGLLVRFAGPRLAASDLGRTQEDPLLPVRLRSGGRTVGGTMSWGDPKSLAPFAENSPFFGLPIPDDVSIRSQVMAQPDPTLASRVIAQLADGTPLVTRKDIGNGSVILFHVTANAEWSNLPLSGLFVQMLERLAISTAPILDDPADLEGTVWMPEKVLDAFGSIEDAGTRSGVDGPVMAAHDLGPDLYPGIYSSDDRSVALNIIKSNSTLTAAAWPAGTKIESTAPVKETNLKGWALAAALLLLSLDILATLLLSGRLNIRRGKAVAGLIMVLSFPMAQPVDAQSTQNDATAIAATQDVVLAYVQTGDRRVDDLSFAGLKGLSETLFQRTSIEPAEPMGVNIETDELAFFPFLYWPVTANTDIPSRSTYDKLNRYLRTGGMILFDTRDADVARFGSASPERRRLQAIARGLDIPPLEPIPQDHILTRTFYLLQEFPGRYASRDIWVEAAPPDSVAAEGMPFRDLNDGVTPVVIGGNDWAAAWATDDLGLPLLPIGRGAAGERQREYARRFGVNLIMHVLTGNYKSDQVHVPALLDRLGQ